MLAENWVERLRARVAVGAVWGSAALAVSMMVAPQIGHASEMLSALASGGGDTAVQIAVSFQGFLAKLGLENALSQDTLSSIRTGATATIAGAAGWLANSVKDKVKDRISVIQESLVDRLAPEVEGPRPS